MKFEFPQTRFAYSSGLIDRRPKYQDHYIVTELVLRR